MVTQFPGAANWLSRDLPGYVKELSRVLNPHLDKLEHRYEKALQAAGINAPLRGLLRSITPLHACRMVQKRKPLDAFFQQVTATGTDLANRNVTPDELIRALQICDELIAAAFPDGVHECRRQQLNFCTMLALDRAYFDVRDAESQALHRLFHIEIESPHVDVLYRRFLELMTEMCGAEAAHLYFLDEANREWRLQASTARAASAKTQAMIPAARSSVQALSRAGVVSGKNRILDTGWERYATVWSIPVDKGVMQFAFSSERPLLPREGRMLISAAERCQAAAQKTRLLENIAQREEQLSKLAIRMLMVEENERRRISRELHDDAGQSLVVIRLQMEMIEQSLPPEAEARERLAEARDITEKTILDIRRLISDLSPAVLEHIGLGAALRQLVSRFRARYPCSIRLEVSDLPQLETNFQLVIYRLAQECFSNIAQHSQASAVNVFVSAADRSLRLHVQDNGTGFTVEEALSRRNCFGLAGIRERVAVLGGTVEITSTPAQPGQKRARKNGTRVSIELPIRQGNVS